MRAGKKGRSGIRLTVVLMFVVAALAVGALVLGVESIALADVSWG